MLSKLENNPLLRAYFEDSNEKKAHLFSFATVYITEAEAEGMSAIIKAIEEVIETRPYQELVLSHAPSIAHAQHGTHGVFMGYDFHLGQKVPQLIEINTNAGGALLNLELAVLHAEGSGSRDLEETFYRMFLNEWKDAGKANNPGLIAIVDDNPKGQFLYPEFKLFERMFEKFGTRCLVADPADLIFEGGKLMLMGEQVDMVYNRLTDFYLEEKSHASLRNAYEAKAVVLTPSPHHHALYANKLNLSVLTDMDTLKKWPLSNSTIPILQNGIPKTVAVTPLNAHELWDRRKHLFFKPLSGYGSKATYRGDKITHKVWGEIQKGLYVAQALVPPPVRMVPVDGKETELKMDIRAYVYRGDIQLFAARLYFGQTTNFRTRGGGFAPVLLTP